MRRLTCTPRELGRRLGRAPGKDLLNQRTHALCRDAFGDIMLKAQSLQRLADERR
jgi:hypothetical protein